MNEDLEAAREGFARAQEVFVRDFVAATPEQQRQMLIEFPEMFAGLNQTISEMEADEVAESATPGTDGVSDAELLKHLVQDARDHGYGYHDKPKEQTANSQTPERRASESRKRLQG